MNCGQPGLYSEILFFVLLRWNKNIRAEYDSIWILALGRLRQEEYFELRTINLCYLVRLLKNKPKPEKGLGQWQLSKLSLQRLGSQTCVRFHLSRIFLTNSNGEHFWGKVSLNNWSQVTSLCLWKEGAWERALTLEQRWGAEHNWSGWWLCIGVLLVIVCSSLTDHA